MPKFSIPNYDIPLTVYLNVRGFEAKLLSIHINKGYLVEDEKGRRWVSWKKIESMNISFEIKGEPFVAQKK